jgi:hypothetical protein
MKLKGGANVWQTLYRRIQDSSRKTTYRRQSYSRLGAPVLCQGVKEPLSTRAKEDWSMQSRMTSAIVMDALTMALWRRRRNCNRNILRQLYVSGGRFLPRLT